MSNTKRHQRYLRRLLQTPSSVHRYCVLKLTWLRPILRLPGSKLPTQNGICFHKLPHTWRKKRLSQIQLSKAPSSSSLDFSLAMAQISTPKTALAKTSEQEYPICSPAVAATPEIPSILMMYTKG